MANRVSDGAIDAALQHIIDNATHLVLLDADPVNFAGVAAAELGSISVVGGDFSLAAGDVSGRKLVVGAKTGLTPSATGVVTHVGIVDNTGSDLLLLVPHNPTNVTSGINVDINSFKHEIEQPVTA